MTATLDRPAVPSVPTGPDVGRRGRFARLLRGPDGAPAWARPALLALLLATFALYSWDLSASGYANSFYAAAVQAGTKSWKAWFFGSLDSGSSITVDKPPASLWIMGLSGRIFGFNSWSLLLPQAVEGVAAAGLLYGGVRRVFRGASEAAGHAAGLIAAGALALTPAAVLMFRFDNPDALLVLLMVAAAYAVTRALEAGRTRWLVVAGSCIGFAFLTKMLQGFLVIPGLGLAYLVAAPVSWRKRCWQLLLAVGALVVSAGWWVLTVQLWPASARPYIGGSGNNSVLGLAFGYNGLSRLDGGTGAGGGGMGGSSGSTGTSFGGATGLARLFSNEFGNEISWLLPAALVALAAGLWLTLRHARTSPVRASLLLWGGWLVVTGVVFAYMKGTIHPYYTVALAPAIGALVGIGAVVAWTRRNSWNARVSLAAIIAAAGIWSVVLLGRVSTWHPEIRAAVGAFTAIAVLGALVAPKHLGRAAGLVVVSGLLAAVLGTGAFAAATATSPHTGSIPTVGPAVASTSGGGLGGGAGAGAGAGGGGDVSTDSALAAALKSSTQTWAAATVGDQSAASLELTSGEAVMSIGGWSGSDASPTLAQFEKDVAAGRIHYFIAGGGMAGGVGGGMGGGGMGGSGGTASAITQWVEAHFTATTIGGTTVYDLTSAS